MISLLDAINQGTGVYSLSEAARYAKMHPQTLRNWFFESKGRNVLRHTQIECKEFKAITFLDFVEAIAIRSLRIDYRLPFLKIREAVKNAKNHGIDHPFARKDHRTVLIGSDLHIHLAEDPVNPVQITGRNVGQKSMRPCLERYMKDLDFDAQGLASLYRAYTFKDQAIVLDPKVHFGDPIVQENGYSANTLYRAAIAEGSIERAAELYEVSVDAVDAAYRYCNSELGLAAA